MKSLMVLTTAAAFAFIAGSASAVTLTNTDKTETKVLVDIGGKQETVSLKENASFDSKGKDATFTIGKEKTISAKADEKLLIKGGKIETAVLVKTSDAVKTEVTPVAAAETKIEAIKTDLAKPVEKTLAVEAKTETK